MSSPFLDPGLPAPARRWARAALEAYADPRPGVLADWVRHTVARPGSCGPGPARALARRSPETWQALRDGLAAATEQLLWGRAPGPATEAAEPGPRAHAVGVGQLLRAWSGLDGLAYTEGWRGATHAGRLQAARRRLLREPRWSPGAAPPAAALVKDLAEEQGGGNRPGRPSAGARRLARAHPALGAATLHALARTATGYADQCDLLSNPSGAWNRDPDRYATVATALLDDLGAGGAVRAQSADLLRRLARAANPAWTPVPPWLLLCGVPGRYDLDLELRVRAALQRTDVHELQADLPGADPALLHALADRLPGGTPAQMVVWEELVARGPDDADLAPGTPAARAAAGVWQHALAQALDAVTRAPHDPAPWARARLLERVTQMEQTRRRLGRSRVLGELPAGLIAQLLAHADRATRLQVLAGLGERRDRAPERRPRRGQGGDRQ